MSDENSQDSSTFPRVLLIDLDNCPKEMSKLGPRLRSFDRVVGCYGGPEPKVSISMVPLLAEAIAEGKLELVGMKGGNNAADFALAFWAGRLVEEIARRY